MNILSVIGNFLGNPLVVTFALCLLGSLSVAIVMRFFVKQILNKVDEYISAKHPDDKIGAIYLAIKSFLYTATAFVLTAVVLSMLMHVCEFPYENNKWLSFLYFIPMLALQFFFDRKMKRLACLMFGLPYDTPDDDDEEKEDKPKKQKIHYKKVPYTVDEEGNEVPVDD